MGFQTDTFDYHISWKTRGHHPGQHKSDQRGMGLEFAGHSNLLDYPDPRRIDLRQTIRDPLEQIYVRIFNQRSSTPVMIASDLSSSMNFGLEKSKLRFTSEISTVISNSVSTRSDAIGFIGFNDQTETKWWAPISYRPHRTNLLIDKLRNYHPKNASHKGIKRVFKVLPKDHTLVFLISDFHMPITDIEETTSAIGVYAANKQINVLLQGLQTGTITVLDMSGRTVYKQAINSDRTVINLKTAAGIYVVEVETSAQTITKKISIQ